MWTKWPASSSISQRPSGGRYRMTFCSGVPQPITSSTRTEDAEERHRQARAGASASTPGATARSRRSASPGRSSSASRRRTRTPPTVTRSTQPLERQARVHPPATAWPARRSFPVCAARSPCGAGGRASRRVSSAIIFVRSCSAMSGIRLVQGCRRGSRDARTGTTGRRRAGSSAPPPLECPITGTGRPGDT